MEVERKIPAVKLFVSQLDKARQPLERTDSSVAVEMDSTNLVGLELHGVSFTRVWLQVQQYCCLLSAAVVRIQVAVALKHSYSSTIESCCFCCCG